MWCLRASKENAFCNDNTPYLISNTVFKNIDHVTVEIMGSNGDGRL